MTDAPPIPNGTKADDDALAEALADAAAASATRDAAPRLSRAEKREQNREAHRATTGGSEPTTRSPRPGAKSKDEQLEEKLITHFGFLGMFVSTFDPVCGNSILEGSERLAKALVKLARENKSVARVLNACMTTSAWGEVTFALAAIMLPIMAHHDLLPGLNKLHIFAMPAENE